MYEIFFILLIKLCIALYVPFLLIQILHTHYKDCCKCMRDLMLNNIKEPSLQASLRQIAKKNSTQNIVAGESYIPVTGKALDEEDILMGVDAALDGWLTAGRFANKFEHEFAQYFGSPKALLVNSGSSANLVAFYALTSPKLGKRAILPGDEVITVAAGFPTTVNPIIQFGAIPVFVDIDVSTHNVNVDILEEAISSKTKAIMINKIAVPKM